MWRTRSPRTCVARERGGAAPTSRRRNSRNITTPSKVDAAQSHPHSRHRFQDSSPLSYPPAVLRILRHPNSTILQPCSLQICKADSILHMSPGSDNHLSRTDLRVPQTTPYLGLTISSKYGRTFSLRRLWALRLSLELRGFATLSVLFLSKVFGE